MMPKTDLTHERGDNSPENEEQVTTIKSKENDIDAGKESTEGEHNQGDCMQESGDNEHKSDQNSDFELASTIDTAERGSIENVDVRIRIEEKVPTAKETEFTQEEDDTLDNNVADPTSEHRVNVSQNERDNLSPEHSRNSTIANEAAALDVSGISNMNGQRTTQDGSETPVMNDITATQDGSETPVMNDITASQDGSETSVMNDITATQDESETPVMNDMTSTQDESDITEMKVQQDSSSTNNALSGSVSSELETMQSLDCLQGEEGSDHPLTDGREPTESNPLQENVLSLGNNENDGMQHGIESFRINTGIDVVQGHGLTDESMDFGLKIDAVFSLARNDLVTDNNSDIDSSRTESADVSVTDSTDEDPFNKYSKLLNPESTAKVDETDGVSLMESLGADESSPPEISSLEKSGCVSLEKQFPPCVVKVPNILKNDIVMTEVSRLDKVKQAKQLKQERLRNKDVKQQVVIKQEPLEEDEAQDENITEEKRPERIRKPNRIFSNSYLYDQNLQTIILTAPNTTNETKCKTSNLSKLDLSLPRQQTAKTKKKLSRIRREDMPFISLPLNKKKMKSLLENCDLLKSAKQPKTSETELTKSMISLLPQNILPDMRLKEVGGGTFRIMTPDTVDIKKKQTAKSKTHKLKKAKDEKKREAKKQNSKKPREKKSKSKQNKLGVFNDRNMDKFEVKIETDIVDDEAGNEAFPEQETKYVSILKPMPPKLKSDFPQERVPLSFVGRYRKQNKKYDSFETQFDIGWKGKNARKRKLEIEQCTEDETISDASLPDSSHPIAVKTEVETDNDSSYQPVVKTKKVAHNVTCKPESEITLDSGCTPSVGVTPKLRIQTASPPQSKAAPATTTLSNSVCAPFSTTLCELARTQNTKKFFQLTVGGKIVLIPSDGINLVPKAYVIDLPTAASATTSQAKVLSTTKPTDLQGLASQICNATGPPSSQHNNQTTLSGLSHFPSSTTVSNKTTQGQNKNYIHQGIPGCNPTTSVVSNVKFVPPIIPPSYSKLSGSGTHPLCTESNPKVTAPVKEGRYINPKTSPPHSNIPISKTLVSNTQSNRTVVVPVSAKCDPNCTPSYSKSWRSKPKPSARANRTETVGAPEESGRQTSPGLVVKTECLYPGDTYLSPPILSPQSDLLPNVNKPHVLQKGKSRKPPTLEPETQIGQVKSRSCNKEVSSPSKAPRPNILTRKTKQPSSSKEKTDMEETTPNSQSHVASGSEQRTLIFDATVNMPIETCESPSDNDPTAMHSRALSDAVAQNTAHMPTQKHSMPMLVHALTSDVKPPPVKHYQTFKTKENRKNLDVDSYIQGLEFVSDEIDKITSDAVPDVTSKKERTAAPYDQKEFVHVPSNESHVQARIRNLREQLRRKQEELENARKHMKT